jgi:type IV secretory pathway TrbD component
LVILLYAVVAIFLLALPWTPLSLTVSGVLVFIGHPGLILLCKHDPDWRRIVLRHVRYQRVYPAAAHPRAPKPRVRPAVPTVQECR